MRENGSGIARAAGQLPAQNAGRVPTGLLICIAPPGTARQGRRAVRRTLALPKDTPAQYRRCWAGVSFGRPGRPLGGPQSLADGLIAPILAHGFGPRAC